MAASLRLEPLDGPRPRYLLTLRLGSLLQLDIGKTTASLRVMQLAHEVKMTTHTQPVAETFGQRIKRRRRECGLTQRQVADKLDIDFTYLSKLENDRGEPPGEKTVRALADALQEDEEELLALAGKVPEGLRDRAQRDVAFARLVRRL